MNCSLGHHVEIGDYGSLSPGVNLGGHTVVGDATLMGIGSCTLQGVIIGREAIIGGQCMVTKNVDDNLTIVGVPARVV
jgi:serine acetyltransferase